MDPYAPQKSLKKFEHLNGGRQNCRFKKSGKEKGGMSHVQKD